MGQAVGSVLDYIAQHRLALWAVTAVACGWALYSALKFGVVASKYGSVERARSPVLFWVYVVVWSAVLVSVSAYAMLGGRAIADRQAGPEARAEGRVGGV